MVLTVGKTVSVTVFIEVFTQPIVTRQLATLTGLLTVVVSMMNPLSPAPKVPYIPFRPLWILPQTAV